MFNNNNQSLRASSSGAETNPGIVDAFVTMANTGLRTAELAALRWSDIDFVRGVLNVHGKSAGRVVPLPDEVLDLLRARATNIPVFTRGEIAHFLEVLRHAGCSPRDLRQAFAMELRRKGVPLEVIPRLLGHTDAKTTLRLFPGVARKHAVKKPTRNLTAGVPRKRRPPKHS